jgi:hypothetical protein
MKQPKNYLSNTPLLTLIAANVVPLFGAVFWDWNTFNIVFLYWAENLAIGFYTILKIAFLPVPNPAERRSIGEFIVKICLILPFTIHYGGFIAIHGLAVLTFFDKEKAGLVMSSYMMGALVALFLSHGVSFVRNYLIKRECDSVKLMKLMVTGPYSRIVVMHIAVFIGGFVILTLGSPLGLLVVLIVLKTAIDARSHLREHQKVKSHKDSFESTSHIETKQIRKEYPYVSSSSGSLFHRSEEPCAEKYYLRILLDLIQEQMQ